MFIYPLTEQTIKYNLDSELEDVLASVENLLSSYQCDHAIMVGDMNMDYKRSVVLMK